MSKFEISSGVGLAFSSAGAFVVSLATTPPPPPPPPPPGTLAPSLVVEYVDGLGVRRTTTVVNGVTSISGVAPLLVEFDASGSRAPAAFAAQSAITDEEAYAYYMAGYRMNYDDGEGVWDYPAGTSYAKNEDTDEPVFGHIFESPGTFTPRLKMLDALENEQTISLTVVATAPPAPVNIPVSAGAWPPFVSNTRYTLNADGDYRSFGDLDTGGLHNIIFEKIGSGADPRIASFRPDPRSKFSATELFEYRVAHIRFINIDILRFIEGQRGFDYCAVIGGKVRNYDFGAQVFAWHEGSNVTRSNVRYCRGLFFLNTEISNENQTNGYVMFGDFRALHCRNTRFVHRVNGATTFTMLRIYGSHHVFRNCLWFCEANGGGANGLPVAQLALSGATPVPWRADDILGPLDGTPSNSDRYGLISDKQIMNHNQIYAAGSFITNAPATVGGGNPTAGMPCYPRLISWSDCVFFPSGDVALGTQGGQLQGQYNAFRNVKKNMGAGADIPVLTNPPNTGIGDSVTFNGPYLIETTNSRPVPTPFA